MLVLHAADLERQGIDIEKMSQMVFYNLIFTKEGTFTGEQRQIASATSQKYLKADILCILVEKQGNFTLWRENKDINLPAKQAAIAMTEKEHYENPFEPSINTSIPALTKVNSIKPKSENKTANSGWAAKNQKSIVY